MLSVIRELAEEAEERAPDAPPLEQLLVRLVRAARTRLRDTRSSCRCCARRASSTPAARACSSSSAVSPRPSTARRCRRRPPTDRRPGIDAIHQELSRYRYCTVFLIEGDELDRDALERELERLGDSLLVVGDRSAIKVHVHTDDPGAALSIGTRVGGIGGVEIADMHEQTAQREERLLAAVPDLAARARDDGCRRRGRRRR